MSAIHHKSLLPSFFAPSVSFDFFDQPEIHEPAPETYEQWRTAAIVPVYAYWFFHQPTFELIRAESEDQALQIVDHSRDGIKARVQNFDCARWKALWRANSFWRIPW